jgi:proline iminopeptidase
MRVLVYLGLFCLGLVMTIPAAIAAPASYFDQTGRGDVLSGGVRMIPIATPKGTFKVWTKRVGNNPKIKVLLLHGGPGATHEYFEALDSYFPGAGIEYYYYDQLGSAYSDQPNDPDLINIEHYVDEVEQVRQALSLDSSNFYLLGQSWGGVLAIEYALKHQANLKGMIISNMMSSIPAYNDYANRVLIPKMDRKAYVEIKKIEDAKDFQNPRYMELLVPNYYEKHILRMPSDQWPEPVTRSFSKINQAIYTPMQGPSEMGASGKLVAWDRSQDLGKITVPTLVIGARYDTMDPDHMKWMASAFANGDYLYCPKGGHLAIYDDQKTYMSGLIAFLKKSSAAN